MKTRTKLGLGFGVQIVSAGVLGICLLFGLAEVRRQFSIVAEFTTPIVVCVATFLAIAISGSAAFSLHS